MSRVKPDWYAGAGVYVGRAFRPVAEDDRRRRGKAGDRLFVVYEGRDLLMRAFDRANVLNFREPLGHFGIERARKLQHLDGLSFVRFLFCTEEESDVELTTWDMVACLRFIVSTVMAGRTDIGAVYSAQMFLRATYFEGDERVMASFAQEAVVSRIERGSERPGWYHGSGLYKVEQYVPVLCETMFDPHLLGDYVVAFETQGGVELLTLPHHGTVGLMRWSELWNPVLGATRVVGGRAIDLYFPRSGRKAAAMDLEYVFRKEEVVVVCGELLGIGGLVSDAGERALLEETRRRLLQAGRNGFVKPSDLHQFRMERRFAYDLDVF